MWSSAQGELGGQPVLFGQLVETQAEQPCCFTEEEQDAQRVLVACQGLLWVVREGT